MRDLQGLLNDLYDSENNALRVSDSGMTRAVIDSPTAGAGTSASPFTHADGSGGISTAIAAAAAADVKVALIRAGHYSVTTTITGFADNVHVMFESGVVLVADGGLVDGIVLAAIGASGDYLENVHIGGFHVKRTTVGSVRLQYLRNSTVGMITAEGTGGGVLSLRDIEGVQFGGVLGWSLGAAGGSAVFALRIEECQFGHIWASGGQEAVDLFETHRCQFSKITSLNAGDEGLDIGSSSHNTFDDVLVYNPVGSGVSIKVEDGGTSVTYGHNKFTNVTVIDHGTIAFSVGNSPAATGTSDTNNWNSVENLTVVSAEAGAIGYKVAGSDAQPVVTGSSLRHFYIKVPAIAVDGAYCTDLTVEDGYAESTGAQAVNIAGTTDSFLATRSTVKRVKCVGSTGVSDGAISLQRAVDFELDDNEVVSAVGCGIFVIRCKRGDITRNRVSDCNHHGIVLDIRDEAAWRGAVDVNITGNKVKNTGKTTANRYGIRAVQTGATTAEGVVIDGNKFSDTQGSPTTNGLQWSGVFDRGSMQGNRFSPLLASSVTGGTVAVVGANSPIRNNVGFKTENNGTATITSGNTSIIVSHGLSTGAPDLQDISVTPTNNLGLATKFWISTPTASQFTINVDLAPGAATATFVWTVSVQ